MEASSRSRIETGARTALPTLSTKWALVNGRMQRCPAGPESNLQLGGMAEAMPSYFVCIAQCDGALPTHPCAGV
jgi:hypothetical protein